MKDFTKDTHVAKALYALHKEVQAALAKDGRKLHMARLVMVAIDGAAPVIGIGCDCQDCTTMAIELLRQSDENRRHGAAEDITQAFGRAH